MTSQRKDSGKYGGKNEADRDGLQKGKKEVAFELNGDSRRVFRVDPARTKWGKKGEGKGRRGWIDSVVFIAPYF